MNETTESNVLAGCESDDVDVPGPRGEWLTISCVAERLDVRVDHLRALVARGEIPFGRVGRLVRFHWPTVQRWVMTNAAKRAVAGAAVAVAR